MRAEDGCSMQTPEIRLSGAQFGSTFVQLKSFTTLLFEPMAHSATTIDLHHRNKHTRKFICPTGNLFIYSHITIKRCVLFSLLISGILHVYGSFFTLFLFIITLAHTIHLMRLVNAHTHTLTWCMTNRKYFLITYSKQIKSKHSGIPFRSTNNSFVNKTHRKCSETASTMTNPTIHWFHWTHRPQQR